MIKVPLINQVSAGALTSLPSGRGVDGWQTPNFSSRDYAR